MVALVMQMNGEAEQDMHRPWPGQCWIRIGNIIFPLGSPFVCLLSLILLVNQAYAVIFYFLFSENG